MARKGNYEAANDNCDDEGGGRREEKRMRL
jgi:hypothetical protein